MYVRPPEPLIIYISSLRAQRKKRVIEIFLKKVTALQGSSMHGPAELRETPLTLPNRAVHSTHVTNIE